MPLTPRDKRTLMIGGGILGVLLVGFLVMNLLAGGGGGEEFPSLPDITVEPDGNGPGQASTSPTVGVSPIPVFTGRDPFSIPPGLTTTVAPTSGTGSTSTSGSTTTTGSTTTGTTTGPTNPGGNSSDVVGGKTVVLLSVYNQGGEPMVQVEVDGRVFNDIGIGDTFDNGRYELRSISGDCATFLYGDESFTLCALSDK
ncbi:MAG TPA: hypothetical protein VF351_07965 [Actinomycetota bacterium]